ncbi:hypothetical protein ACFOYY_07890 [Streptosporangium jomthongense]|uniref:DUF3108 domain-containing protein n=3 Tax=Streptosporangium TaxID=2000 RepID=A0ABV8EUH9_9ACTN
MSGARSGDQGGSPRVAPRAIIVRQTSSRIQNMSCLSRRENRRIFPVPLSSKGVEMALSCSFLVATTSLTLLAPHQTALASPDPVTVMEKLMTPGNGVTTSAKWKFWLSDRPATSTITFHTTGVLAFGKGRAVAADATRLSSGGRKVRFRVVGGRTYASGGAWSDMLPQGKTWARSSILDYQPYEFTEQDINIFEPTTLRELLKSARSDRGTTTTRYSGSITVKALCAVSPSCRSEYGKKVNADISWQLWTNEKGQVVRLFAKWVLAKTAKNPISSNTEADTSYSGWGSRVSVSVPPANQVAKVD